MANNGLKLLLSFKAFSRFLVLMPVLIPFLESKGLSLAQVFSLTGIYSVSCAIFEFPTGIIADNWGKKRSLQLGALIFLLAQIGYLAFDQYWALLIVNVCLGLAASFFSGTDSALLHSYLKQKKNLTAFNKYEGRLYAVSTYAEALAGLLAGLLASLTLYLNAYAQIGAAVIALLFAVLLPKEEMAFKFEQADYVITVKEIWKQLKIKAILRKLLVLSVLLGLSTLALTWFSQAYLKEINLPLFWYGIIWTSLNLLVGFGASFSHQLEKKFQLINLSFIAAIFIALSHLAIGAFSSKWMICILLIAFLLRGISTPALRSLIHAEIPDRIRTSFFSFRSLLIRALYGLTAMGISLVNSQYSFKHSLIAFGGIITILFTALFLSYSKAQKKG